MGTWTDLHELAAAQRGLVARRQVLATGVRPDTWQRHRRRRGWRRIAPGVWLAPGAPEPDHLHARAVLLSVGPPVALARWSAAAVHGLRPSTTLVQLVVPAGRRATALPMTQTLRTRVWRDEDVAEVDGLAVTTVPRTLWDLAAVTDLDPLRSLVIDARQRRLLELPDLVGQGLAFRRAKGGPRMRQVLAELDEDGVESAFELAVATWLRAAGHAVVAQHPVRVAGGRVLRLDLALPDRRVAVECDGFGFHRTRRDLELDARRHNALALAGWRVLRVTWDQFTRSRDRLAADLDALVRAA